MRIGPVLPFFAIAGVLLLGLNSFNAASQPHGHTYAVAVSSYGQAAQQVADTTVDAMITTASTLVQYAADGAAGAVQYAAEATGANSIAADSQALSAALEGFKASVGTVASMGAVASMSTFAGNEVLPAILSTPLSREADAVRAAQPTVATASGTAANATAFASAAKSVTSAAAAVPAATATAAVSAITGHMSDCNRDHSRVLSLEDALCRVPAGALAYISLSNGAYGTLGINWALLLLPLLEKIGHGDRAFLYALDDEGVRQFTSHKLPTIAQSTKAKHNPRTGSSDGFRWEPGAFRDYGVTKAEAILFWIRRGRDVCISDVDAAWVAPPYVPQQLVPEANVLPATRPADQLCMSYRLAQVRPITVCPRGGRALWHRLPERAMGRRPFDTAQSCQELRSPARVQMVRTPFVAGQVPS